MRVNRRTPATTVTSCVVSGVLPGNKCRTDECKSRGTFPLVAGSPSSLRCGGGGFNQLEDKCEYT